MYMQLSVEPLKRLGKMFLRAEFIVYMQLCSWHVPCICCQEVWKGLTQKLLSTRYAYQWDQLIQLLLYQKIKQSFTSWDICSKQLCMLYGWNETEGNTMSFHPQVWSWSRDWTRTWETDSPFCKEEEIRSWLKEWHFGLALDSFEILLSP